MNLGFFSSPIKANIAYSCPFPGDKWPAILIFQYVTVPYWRMHHIGHDGIEPSLLPYQRSFLPLKECPESGRIIRPGNIMSLLLRSACFPNRTGRNRTFDLRLIRPPLYLWATVRSFTVEWAPYSFCFRIFPRFLNNRRYGCWPHLTDLKGLLLFRSNNRRGVTSENRTRMSGSTIRRSTVEL